MPDKKTRTSTATKKKTVTARKTKTAKKSTSAKSDLPRSQKKNVPKKNETSSKGGVFQLPYHSHADILAGMIVFAVIIGIGFWVSALSARTQLSTIISVAQVSSAQVAPPACEKGYPDGTVASGTPEGGWTCATDNPDRIIYSDGPNGDCERIYGPDYGVVYLPNGRTACGLKNENSYYCERGFGPGFVLMRTSTPTGYNGSFEDNWMCAEEVYDANPPACEKGYPDGTVASGTPEGGWTCATDNPDRIIYSDGPNGTCAREYGPDYILRYVSDGTTSCVRSEGTSYCERGFGPGFVARRTADGDNWMCVRESTSVNAGYGYNTGGNELACQTRYGSQYHASTTPSGGYVCVLNESATGSLGYGYNSGTNNDVCRQRYGFNFYASTTPAGGFVCVQRDGVSQGYGYYNQNTPPQAQQNQQRSAQQAQASIDLRAVHTVVKHEQKTRVYGVLRDHNGRPISGAQLVWSIEGGKIVGTGARGTVQFIDIIADAYSNKALLVVTATYKDITESVTINVRPAEKSSLFPSFLLKSSR